MPPAHEAEGSRAPSCAGFRSDAGEHAATRRRRGRRVLTQAAAAGAVLVASTSHLTAAAPFPATASEMKARKSQRKRLDAMHDLPSRDKLSPRRDEIRPASLPLTPRQGLPDEEDIEALAENLQHFEDVWKSGRFETHVEANSHDDGTRVTQDNAPVVFPIAKGKQRAQEPTSPYYYNLEALHDAPLRKAEKSRSTMRLTSQRSPFHSSEVGRLASLHPNPLSVGLFRPDYPFLPSGRKRPKPSLFNSTSEAGVYHYRNGAAQHGSLYTLPVDVTHGNVFKHGWTSTMLDDDMRLSVPDEFRRPRRDSALAIAKRIAGMPWYRWKPGEGYVLSTRKDYSAYKHGPGIALGQLLPPREHPYTSHLPLIPNDAKRDLVWMVFCCIFVLATLAFGSEIRSLWRSQRKGKQRQLNIPLIRILHDERAASTSTAVQGSIGLRSRQRSKARSIHEMCKAALDSPLSRLRSRNPYAPLRSSELRGKQSKSGRLPTRVTVDSSRRAQGLLGSPGRKKKRSSSEAESSEVEEGLVECRTVMASSSEPSARPNGLMVRVMSAPPPTIESSSATSSTSSGNGSSGSKDSDMGQLVFVSSIENNATMVGGRSSDSSTGTSGSTSTSKNGSASSSSGSSGTTSIDMYTHPDSACSIAARLASIQPYNDFDVLGDHNKRRRRHASVDEHGSSSYPGKASNIGMRP